MHLTQRRYDYDVRLAEEPLLPSTTIQVLWRSVAQTHERPGDQTSSPLSNGITVELQGADFRTLGQLHLLCVLNFDAARAFRDSDLQAAWGLVQCANKVERSPAAAVLRDSIKHVAHSIPSTLDSDELPDGLQNYVRRSCRSVLDPPRPGVFLEWLSRTSAWLDLVPDVDAVREAVVDIDAEIQKARANWRRTEDAAELSWLGIVARYNEILAEVDGDWGSCSVPRRDLEEAGLLDIGQPVALIHERLTHGAAVTLPIAAVDLERNDAADESYDAMFGDPTGEDHITMVSVADRDFDWLHREFGRPHTPLPPSVVRRS